MRSLKIVGKHKNLAKIIAKHFAHKRRYDVHYDSLRVGHRTTESILEYDICDVLPD